MKGFTTLKSEVEKVLQKYPKARDDDKWLVYKTWCEMYPGKVVSTPLGAAIPFSEMLKLSDEQIIARIRRKFNQKGLYKATDPEVIKARAKKEKKVKQEIVYGMALNQY